MTNHPRWDELVAAATLTTKTAPDHWPQWWMVCRPMPGDRPHKLFIGAANAPTAEDLARTLVATFHVDELFSVTRMRRCSTPGCKRPSEPGHRHCRPHYLEWKAERSIVETQQN